MSQLYYCLIFAGFRATGRFDGNNLLEMRATSFDPTRPIRSWRTAWRKLTNKAGLKGLCFHDLRHHRTKRVRRKRTNHHGDCGICLAPDVGAVQPYQAGSQAHRFRSAIRQKERVMAQTMAQKPASQLQNLRFWAEMA